MIRPLHDFLVVQVETKTEMSEGGIAIPSAFSSNDDATVVGVVLAYGPGKRNDKDEIEPLEIEIGDKVIFGKTSGTEINDDGNTVTMIHESEVIVVLE